MFPRIVVLIFLSFSGATYAQSQSEMTSAACDEYKKADQKLTETYNSIRKAYTSDQLFLKHLEMSQKAWLAYRDAQLKMTFPHEERGYYGSVQPMCECEKLADYTNNRLKELKQWLDGIEEGDVCAGSVRMNKPLAQ